MPRTLHDLHRSKRRHTHLDCVARSLLRQQLQQISDSGRHRVPRRIPLAHRVERRAPVLHRNLLCHGLRLTWQRENSRPRFWCP